MKSDYLNTKQAAAEYGLSVSYLNKLRVSGGGPPYAKIGRRVLYRRCDLERWISMRVRHHTSNDDLADATGTTR